MSIPIECDACHRQYKVDDKLAGKKVKCKGCGALIRVPAQEPADEPRECLSCGSPLAPGNRVCPKCGFNIQTGQKESLLLDSEADALKARKKLRWERKPGSPLLESLDEIIKLIVILALLGGIVMTIVHVCRSPAGFSFQTIAPTLLVLAALGGIMPAVASLAINFTVKSMKLAPRNDTFVRIALCILLPYAISMLSDWPETGDWDWIARLGWPAAVLLLVYFFRADVIEWLASLLAALGAIGIALILVTLLGGAINDIAGNLYADMLPAGPWTGLAKGHSPPPADIPVAPPTIAATKPTPATIVASPSTQTTPGVVTTQDAGPTTALAGATPPTDTASTMTGASTGPQPAPLKITSPFFAAVIDDPGIRDSSAIVTPPTPADWMLTIKNMETTVEVDRWSLNPLEKKEHFSYPFFAKKAPQFAISPKGDAVAALSFFPRRQLEVIPFDNKTPKKTIFLDLPSSIPDGATAAAPVLLGILDPTHYYLRWDLSGTSALQIFNAPLGTPAGTSSWRAAQLGPAADNAPPTLSPNGRTTAVFGKNTITFANLDGTIPSKPIVVASDLSVRLLGMTFSADNTQIALYAAVSDLPTLMTYQLKNGDPVYTTLLSQTPVDKDAPSQPHDLLWLPGAQALLIRGTDLLDAATGRKFASLALPNLLDQQLIGPSAVALTFKTPAGPHTIIAKLDDDKIRAAKPK